MADTVRDVMTPDPLTVTSQATVERAAQAMRANDVGDILVTEDGRLVGIVTDRDIVVRAIAAGRNPPATLVEECYSTELYTVGSNESTGVAAQIMRDHALRRLPVVDDGELVGVISLGDLAVAEDPTSALANISAAPPND